MSTVIEPKITSKEAVYLLREHGYELTDRSIRRMCQNGRIAGARKLGKLWYISRRQIMKMIEE